MQKKINILSTLLVIVLILGGVSTCTTRSARQAMKAGWEEGFEEGYNAGRGMTSYEKGYNAGLAVKERQKMRKVSLHLVPKNYGEFTEEILNAKEGSMEQMSLRDVQVNLKSTDSSGADWIAILFEILLIVYFLFFIYLLFRLVVSIKAGEIFDRDNEKLLRWMSVLFFIWFFTDLVMTYSEYRVAKASIALENYSIAMDRPSFFPLVIGIVFLLFAQIFAMGRKMKEDQEFMV